MEKMIIDGVEYNTVGVRVAESSNDDPNTAPVLEFTEGEFAGTQFVVSDLRIDDQDAALLHYSLSTSDPATVDKIKPLVDDWLIVLLYKQAIQHNETASQ